MIGIIGGTNFVEEPLIKGRLREIHSKYGMAYAFIEGDIAFMQRHLHNEPAYMVNHRANLIAMKELGVTHVIGICSCGSLKKTIKPGEVMVPHDYISLWHEPSFEEGDIIVTPGLDEEVRKALLQKGVRKNGVYFQTQGPRLETKAEIKFLKDYADIVGMTLGSEATLCKQLGLKYAAVCSIDNYANGIAKNINVDDINALAARNAPKIRKIALNAASRLSKIPREKRKRVCRP
ncbi:MAG: MTAP family purine nucleoside phosphorylase [Candidatus Diapherotrites archaeon]|nr:MTAP family purine nucleoside phosphorylase [Candidatus Diapherotrites archaeon]